MQTQKNLSIDFTESFTLLDIRTVKYTDLGFGYEELINDLQRCFVAVYQTPVIFIFKDYDAIDKIYKASYTNVNVARQKLKMITINHCGDAKINAWQVYEKNVERFTLKGLAFYEKDPTVFSYFRGYNYEKLEDVKMKLIQPFLDHIQNVIANGNKDVYKYILMWIAAVLQGPDAKVGTALVILGNEGTGKNQFFTDVICKLMSRYSNKNVTTFDDIVGKFNAILENKKLIVLNEIQSVDMNIRLNTDALKSVITDNRVIINQKNEPTRDCQNVANFIFISNNDIPIRMSQNDRRYMVTKTSDIHKQDEEYYNGLTDTFETAGFYENLFTFFMIQEYSMKELRRIPSTQPREDIKEASMSVYEIFVRDNFEHIVNITGPDLYNLYCTFCKENGHHPAANRTFIAGIKMFTGDARSVRSKTDKKVVKWYNLTEECIKKFKKYNQDLVEASIGHSVPFSKLVAEGCAEDCIGDEDVKE